MHMQSSNLHLTLFKEVGKKCLSPTFLREQGPVSGERKSLYDPEKAVLLFLSFVQFDSFEKETENFWIGNKMKCLNLF